MVALVNINFTKAAFFIEQTISKYKWRFGIFYNIQSHPTPNLQTIFNVQGETFFITCKGPEIPFVDILIQIDVNYRQEIIIGLSGCILSIYPTIKSIDGEKPVIDIEF